VIDKWAAYVERLEKNIKQLGIVIEDLNDALQLANNERLACEKTLAKLKIKDHNLMQLYNELLLELQKLKGKKKMDRIVLFANNVYMKLGSLIIRIEVFLGNDYQDSCRIIRQIAPKSPVFLYWALSFLPALFQSPLQVII